MIYLRDDGTLDTVVSCDICGREQRFSIESASYYRDSDGAMIDFVGFVEDLDIWCDCTEEEE